MPKDARIAVRLDAETRARLVQLAARTGRPLSHVLRAALMNAEQAVPRAWFETGKFEEAAGAGQRATG
jgi:predicted transcriptional regulator